MDRLLILLGVLAGLGLLWLVWRGAKYTMRRSIQVDKDSFRGDRPALLYFYTDDCAPCRLQQGPILASLQEMMGDGVHFQEYDALAHPDLASQYRVLTVPTTVVIAPDGAVVAVNYGVTQSSKLRRQIEQASAGPGRLLNGRGDRICVGKCGTGVFRWFRLFRGGRGQAPHTRRRLPAAPREQAEAE